MAPKEGRGSASNKRSTKGSRGKHKHSEGFTDPNASRREQYHSDSQYRELQKERSRKSYRSRNPKSPSTLKKGIQQKPVQKEVNIKGLPYPRVMQVYSIADAAAALGKTRVTLKKWIDDGFVPEPVIYDTSRGYEHYSEKEVQLIAKVLVVHERDFDYLHHTHETTINMIWQYIEGYRKSMGEDHA